MTFQRHDKLKLVKLIQKLSQFPHLIESISIIIESWYNNRDKVSRFIVATSLYPGYGNDGSLKFLFTSMF